jgi:hypothetical protein
MPDFDALQQAIQAAVRAGVAEARSEATPEGAAIPLSDLDTEILLALLWAGPFLKPQLLMLLYPAWQERQVRRRLDYLAQQGLLTSSWYYRSIHKADRPRRIGKVWSVSATGQTMLEGHARAPRRPVPPPRILIDHDVAVSAALVHLIRQTRPILSGVAVFREQRIDDTTAITPIADALIILRTRLRPATASVLPWSDRPRATDEQFRIVSVEVDRGTEDLGVIAEKARSYRRLPNDPTFQERYRGLCPEVLWVAPTERRMRSIDQTWRATWPEGTWHLTHDQALSRDQFWTSEPGGLRSRGWLDDWQAAAEAAQDYL